MRALIEEEGDSFFERDEVRRHHGGYFRPDLPANGSLEGKHLEILAMSIEALAQIQGVESLHLGVHQHQMRLELGHPHAHVELILRARRSLTQDGQGDPLSGQTPDHEEGPER